MTPILLTSEAPAPRTPILLAFEAPAPRTPILLASEAPAPRTPILLTCQDSFDSTVMLSELFSAEFFLFIASL